MRNKLTLTHLKKIISEETQAAMKEIDLAAEGNVYNTANKLLIAIGNFKKNSNPNMLSAIKADLAKLEKHLNNMKLTPSQYVVSTKVSKVKKVSLKPVGNSDDIIL